MYTPRHDRAAAATEILVATGDQSTSRYGGSIQKRFRSGIGYALAADYWNAPTYNASSSDAQETNAWLQLSYLRGERWGLQFQYLGQTPDRAPYVASDGDTLGAGVKGTRGDMQFRAFMQGGSGELTRRVDLVFSSTGWSGSGVSQRINGVGRRRFVAPPHALRLGERLSAGRGGPARTSAAPWGGRRRSR